MARTARNLAEIFSLVETGSIVFFPPASLARRYPRPGLAYQPVTDLPAATLVVAWPRDARSPAVAAFVRAACTVAATVPAPGQNLMETFSALPVRSRAMRKASPTSSIGSMWLSSGDTSIAASAISRTAYRNDSRPGSPWAP